MGAVTRAEAGIETLLAVHTCALSQLTGRLGPGGMAGGVCLEYLYRVRFCVSYSFLSMTAQDEDNKEAHTLNRIGTSKAI